MRQRQSVQKQVRNAAFTSIFAQKQQAFVGYQTAREIFRLEAVAFISIACMCTGKKTLPPLHS
jgi:hypothetical protein